MTKFNDGLIVKYGGEKLGAKDSFCLSCDDSRMLFFIDESGDPGLKFDSGSTDYFIVTLVAFEDNAEALAADHRIQLLKQELHLPAGFEFHFNKLKRAYREAFLSIVAGFNWFYFGVVINKRMVTGADLRFKESFHQNACGLVFENARPHLGNATVVIDGSGSREFRREFGTYLRKRVNDTCGDQRIISKVMVQDSRSNNLLQLADMVCGTVARNYGGKEDAAVHRRLICQREIQVVFWPK